MTVGELVIQIGFELDSDATAQIQSQIDGLQEQINTMLGNTSEAASDATSEVSEGLDEAKKKESEGEQGGKSWWGSFKSSGMAATTAIIAALKEINSMIEAWYQVDVVLDNINTDLESTAEVHDYINDAANELRVSYSTIGESVGDLVRTGNSLFQTTEEAADFLVLADKQFKASGASESEIASLNNALVESFRTGRVSAGAFNSIMSESPETISLLAESLNMSEQQVKSLGTQGKLTAAQLYTAFESSSEEIEESFSNVRVTISEAFGEFKNSLGTFLTNLNDATGLTDMIAENLEMILGYLEPIFSLIIDSCSFIFDFINQIYDLLSPVYDVMMDFFNVVMDALNEIMAACQKIVTSIIEPVMRIVSRVIDIVMSFVNKIMPTVSKIIDLVVGVIEMIADLISGVLDVIFAALEPILELIMELVDVFMSLLAPILEVIVELITAIMNVLTPILDLLQPLFDMISQIINSGLMKFLEPVLDALGTVSELLSSLFGDTELLQKAFQAMGEWFSKVGDWFSKIWQKIKDFFQKIKDAFNNVKEFLQNMFKSIANFFIKIVNGIIDGFEAFCNFFVKAINGFTQGLSKIWTWMGIPAIPEINEVSFKRISYLAEGGYIGRNMPRLAVIGDNMTEGEIVAPESKLRENVMLAMQMVMDNFSPASKMAALSGMSGVTYDNRVFNTNTQIYNTFEGGKDLQKTETAAATDIANQVVEQINKVLAGVR
ncbi:MAG: tape measure protein [Clostridia bacterium]|nr:tape measure protein [Clostridia bacterium]